MLNSFLNYVNQQHLFPSGRQVLLAVSGGRDSVAMFHLCRLAGIPFAVAHCNFHLRGPESDRDEHFVCRLCKQHHVTYFSADFDTLAFAKAHGLSVEEAARELRYRWFATLCEDYGYPCVAVAHHRDDSTETFFLNLFRGTGIAGLRGIRPRSVVFDTLVIRPMLCFSRKQIDSFLRKNNFDFVEDCTNATLEARRNRIRNLLLPPLRKHYPAFDQTMAANIARLAEVAQVYDNYIDLMRQRLLLPLPRRVPTLPVPLQGIYLPDVPQPQRTILHELLLPFGLRDSAVRSILSPSTKTGALFPTPTHNVILDRDRIVIGPKADPVEPLISYCEERFSNGKAGIFVDADRLEQPLSLRLWQPGDRMMPFNFNHFRKISDILKDLKLNRIEKDHVWLLLDATGRVVWIVGLMMDNRFRTSFATRRTLHICLEER